jgi:hypothetical protein
METRGLTRWHLFAGCCLMLLAIIAFSGRLASMLDTDVDTATVLAGQAEANAATAKASLREHQHKIELAVEDCLDTVSKANYDLGRANKDERSQNNAKNDLQRVTAVCDALKAKQRDDDWEMKGLITDRNDAVAALTNANEALRVARAKVIQSSWKINSFVLGCFGAFTVTMFELFGVRGRREINEDPIALCCMMMAGGLVALMAVSYLASMPSELYFNDVDRRVDHQLRIISIAIASGISWDIVVRGVRQLTEWQLARTRSIGETKEEAASETKEEPASEVIPPSAPKVLDLDGGPASSTPEHHRLEDRDHAA